MHSSLDPHGGNIYKEARLNGIKREDILDYSANINPLGVPESLKKVLSSSIDSLVNYPDPECSELKTKISQYVDISEDHIIIGNGASEIIFLLMEALQPKNILIPAPTFSEYAKAAEHFGAGIHYFERREEDGYKLDLDNLIMHLDKSPDCVILCNPNNPSSTLETRSDLLRLLEHAKEKGILVIMDEAFIELTKGANNNSMVYALKDFDNLFIIRAFTKLFAVPGLRLGYGLGERKLIREMWKRKLPWSVNTFAASIGSVLFDSEYLGRTEKWLDEELDWFYSELCKFPALKVLRPQTNFILLKILEDGLDVKELRTRLLKYGILIRDASNFVFLDEKFFRIAVKDRKSNALFIKVLKEVLGSR